MKRWLATLLVMIAPAALAQTQEGTPTRVRGTIESFDGSRLVIATRGGQSLTVTTLPNFTFSAVARRDLSDIKAGDFVASTSTRGADGKLKAIEVHFLPKGVNEGQFPYDLAPDSLMTNAVVAGVTDAPDGRTLRVTFKGTEADILVPTDAPVVAFVPGDAALAKPGAAIVVSAIRKPDGSLAAGRATVEKDGVKPPM